MAISGIGQEYDVTLKTDATMKTTTTQFGAVAIVPGTTSSDHTAVLCGTTAGTATPTASAFHAIGINQTYLSASSDSMNVRLFGISKAKCAESITAGEYVMAYWGVSTTTFAGHIVAVDDGVTVTVYGATIASHVTILGRALEAGSTNSVISIFVNPQLYDLNLVGTIGIT